MVVNPLYNLPESIRENIVLAVVPTIGSYRDWSSIGNVVSANGSMFWRLGGLRNALCTHVNNEYLLIDANSNLLSTDMSIFWSGTIEKQLNNCYVLANITTNPWFYILKNNIVLYDKTNYSLLACNLISAKSLGVTATGISAKPYFYKNGTFLGLGGSVVALSPGLNNWLALGTTGSSGLRNPTESILLLNTVLTESQFGLLHNWSQELKSPRFRWQGVDWPVCSCKKTGLVAAWDCGFIDQLVCEDKSGNGNDGLVNGAIHPYISPVGRVARFDGRSGIIDCGNDSSLRPKDALTVVATIKSNNVSNIELINYRKTSANLFILYTIRDDIAAINVDDGSPNGLDVSVNFDTNISDKLFHRVALVFNREESKLYAYVDGVKQIAEGNTQGYPLNSDHPTLNKLYIGGAALPRLRPADASIGTVSIYSRAFSQDEIRNDYNEFAKTPTLIAPIEYSPESLVEEGGAKHVRIGDTDFYCGDSVGRWKVVRDDSIEGGRAIECQISGINYIPSLCAYGTWEFDYCKCSDAGEDNILVISSVIANVSDSNQNGYYIQINNGERLSLRRTINGSLAVLFYTKLSYITLNTWYTIRLTRNATGVFTMMIKGGNFAQWTLVDPTGGLGTNPVTDTTHTLSKYIVCDFDADDKQGPVKTYAGVLTP